MPKKAAAPAPSAAKKAPAPKAGSQTAAPAKSDKKSTSESKSDASPAPVKKPSSSKAPVKAALKPAPLTAKAPVSINNLTPVKITRPANWEMTPWHKKQRQKLIELRDAMVDAMDGVARDTLEGSEASAFGMHQADAGSDAYDRDFALSMLSKEQDALYEIEEALKRMDAGTYGICEMSEKKIPQLRLEAIPFARYTVECQAQLEKENRGGYGRRPPVRSLFGLGGEDDDDDEESEGGSSGSTSSDSND